ncbi:MAG: hypothetical protein ACI8QC_004015 [Planctomycetota bacterium]|jgi:hypothetical protein
MRNRVWLMLALVVGLMDSGLARQNEQYRYTGSPALDAHLAAVFTERRLAAEDAWSRADEAGRACAERVCNPSGRPQLPRLHARSTELYTRYARALTGMEFERLGSLRQRFADSFDMRVVPSGGAAAEGQGLPLTIVMRPLYPLLSEKQWGGLEEVRLVWIDREGKERLARRESTGGRRLPQEGFPLFVTAPSGGAGDWRLVSEWVFGEELYRGWPVVVSLDESGRPAGDYGLRSGVGGAFGLLDARLGALRPEPVELEYSADGRDAVLDIPEGKALRATVLVVLQGPEQLRGAFAGEAGAGWGRLAEGGVRVLATLRSFDGEHEPTALTLMERQSTDKPRVLVVRGTMVRRLLSSRVANQVDPYDGLVVSLFQLGAGVPPALAPGLRSLFLEPLAGTDVESQTDPSAPDQLWIQRTAPPVFAELELPELIDGWLPAGG